MIVSSKSEWSGIGKIGFRIAVEWMIWLPLALVFTTHLGVGDRLGKLVMIALFIVLGLLLYQFPPLWRKLAMITVIVSLIALGIVKYTNLLPVFLWLGIVLWRGRFRTFSHWHYCLAFCVCCLSLVLSAKEAVWAPYRPALIGLSVGWVVLFFYVLNRRLVENAGLHSGIVTNSLRKASRKYALIFVAAGVIVIALSVNYGERWLTPKQIRFEIPTYQVEQPRPPRPPKPIEIPEWMEDMVEEQGEPSIIWEYAFWALIGIGVFGAIWFVRLGWKDRRWSWRVLVRTIREWFLQGKQQAEELPYVEEHRSLQKDKKKGGRFFASLFRKQNRGVNWEQLSSPEKVRHLYERAVFAGIKQGYAFKASHTPSETLEGIDRWRSSGKTPDSEQNVFYWSQLLNIRMMLLRLYEKAKYSPHEVTEQEAQSLKEQIPDR